MRGWNLLTAPLFAAGLIWLAGCPSSTTNTGDDNDDGNGDGTDTATTIEEEAIDSAVAALEALYPTLTTQSTLATEGGSQSALDSPDSDDPNSLDDLDPNSLDDLDPNSLDDLDPNSIDDFDPDSLDFDPNSVGESFDPCLELDFSTGSESGVFAVEGDIPADCESAVEESFDCAGGFAGEIDIDNSSFSLEFSEFTCNEHAIDGFVDASFTNTDAGIQGSAVWDITFEYEGQSIGTNGDGTFSTDSEAEEVVVNQFEGELDDDGTNYGLTLDQVVWGLNNTNPQIPSGGSVSLSGDDIRDVVITFDENSPETGEVTVVIDGTITVVYNVLGA